MSRIRAIGPIPTSTRFKIVIEHLWNGQTRVQAPFNHKKLCYAMLQDAGEVVNRFKGPQSENEEKADSLIVEPDSRIIIADG